MALSSRFLANSTTRSPKTWESATVRCLTRSRTLLVIGLATIPPRVRLMAPTLGEMLIPLSLTIRMMSVSECPALFIPSYERPQVSAPSPTMATTLLSPPRRSRAMAMPSAADMAVPAWPAPNWSCALSERLRKPESPPVWRRLGNSALRPVSSFQA